MIVVVLRGRIGNQLFIYAYARALQFARGNQEKIVIYEDDVLEAGWINSLRKYDLPKVRYISGWRNFKQEISLRNRLGLYFYHKLVEKERNYVKKYKKEQKYKDLFNMLGISACENGYLDLHPIGKKILVSGYFQSEKYFEKYKHEIKREFNLKEKAVKANKEMSDFIINNNTVCISIKVEHNIGSKLYDVCTKKYWEEAINYIIEHVENPAFLVCSDDVEYVCEHLIDTKKYPTIVQDKNLSVELSLAMMSLCKHFIIGNTTYGWWAQYLCTNPDKVVVAPAQWMLVDMPIDIYQEGWITIDTGLEDSRKESFSV